MENVIAQQGSWAGAELERVVYCTARVDASTNPSGHGEQDIYLQALRRTKSVDWIEFGNYVARVKSAMLAVADPKTGKPKLATAAWPVLVKDKGGKDVRDARFLVQYMHLEEKGSDVNVASHLLLDVLSAKVDAAVVVSNDSDLVFPLAEVRKRVPVGLINPRDGFTAGALKGNPGDGVGRHWWWKLQRYHYRNNQLPDPVGQLRRPTGW